MLKNELVRKGTIAEHKIISELLNRGWNVYNNICDTNGVDLVIEKHNEYKKIQIKVSTRTNFSMGHERYAFGLGHTGIQSDFYICVMPNNISIIPADDINSNKAFCIYPNAKRGRDKSFSKRFLNRWDLLDNIVDEKQEATTDLAKDDPENHPKETLEEQEKKYLHE